MALIDIRKQFIKTSGRWDLVVDDVDYADNGADFYINAGMKMLDRLVDIPDSTARIFYKPIAGEYSLTINSDCRAIKEVWANNDTSRWMLTKVEPEDLKIKYNLVVESTTAGKPLYYSYIDSRSLAADYQDDLGEFLNKTAVDGSGYGFRGIVFAPPLDDEYVIEVIGLFKQLTLTNDSDSNFWTFKESDLLLRAALYKLEAFSRGTENAKNWLSAILDDVRFLDYDVAEEESYGIDQMKG